MTPFQLMNMFKQTQNPFVLMRQMAGNNPQMQNMIENLQGKTPQELEQYARNMAKSANINLSNFMNQFGLNIR